MSDRDGETRRVRTPRARRGGPPISVPVPGSDLARRLDARRRAGLQDPVWTLTAEERREGTELLGAIRAALDDPTFGSRKDGSRTAVDAERLKIVRKAGLDPHDRPTLTGELHRLARILYGDIPPAGASALLSLIDPHTGRVTGQRVSVIAASVIAAGVVPFMAHSSVLILLSVIGVLALVAGLSTRRIARDSRRLSSPVLTPGSAEVRTVESSDSSYPVAEAVTRNVAVILDAAPEPDADNVADLLAERDRILTDLVELDSRRRRLEAIEADTDEANAVHHAQLVSELGEWERHLHYDADRIADRAASVQAAIAAADRERRQALARAELDALAAPPPQTIQKRTTEE